MLKGKLTFEKQLHPKIKNVSLDGEIATVENCSVKVTGIYGDKNRIKYSVDVFGEGFTQSIYQEEFSFTPSMNKNFIAQAYEDLKTRERFSHLVSDEKVKDKIAIVHLPVKEEKEVRPEVISPVKIDPTPVKEVLPVKEILPAAPVQETAKPAEVEPPTPKKRGKKAVK